MYVNNIRPEMKTGTNGSEETSGRKWTRKSANVRRFANEDVREMNRRRRDGGRVVLVGRGRTRKKGNVMERRRGGRREVKERDHRDKERRPAGQ